MSAQPTTDKITTADLENLLRTKYPHDRYALFFDVPDAVSLDQRRRIDAIACGIWKSVGRNIEGFELKASRSDWLREVKQVDKADPFLKLCDRFWLVTTDASVAKIEEIPAAWGWMSATKTGLRIQRPAATLPGCGEDIPREFFLGVMRKMQGDIMLTPDVRSRLAHMQEDMDRRVSDEVGRQTRRQQRDLEDAQTAIKQFEEQSGIKLNDWRYGKVGKMVKDLMDLGFGKGLAYVPQVLEQQANVLSTALEQINELRSKLASTGAPSDEKHT
jgi:hypothetical protein